MSQERTLVVRQHLTWLTKWFLTLLLPLSKILLQTLTNYIADNDLQAVLIVGLCMQITVQWPMWWQWTNSTYSSTIPSTALTTHRSPKIVTTTAMPLTCTELEAPPKTVGLTMPPLLSIRMLERLDLQISESNLPQVLQTWCRSPIPMGQVVF